MPHPGRRSRVVRLAAAALLAGFVMTVGVSWSLALWREVSWDRHASRTRGARDRDPAAGEGAGRVTVERFLRTGSAFFETYASDGRGSTETASTSTLLTPGPPIPDPAPEEITPRWLRSEVIPWSRNGWPPTNPRNYAYVDARGWPMLALYCTYDLERPGGKLVAVARGAIELPGKVIPKGSWYGGGYPPSLPLRPRWTGLLVNTIFYACVVFTPLYLAGAARRARRRRRGRCIACGYDLRGTPAGAVCPECSEPGPLAP